MPEAAKIWQRIHENHTHSGPVRETPGCAYVLNAQWRETDLYAPAQETERHEFGLAVILHWNYMPLMNQIL